MKDKIRQAIRKVEYDVTDFYKVSGWAQAMAKHLAFEYFTLAVIGVNAIWIAIDIDLNTSAILVRAPPIFQVVEHFFCAYFSFEWSVRFSAFKVKSSGLKDAWFCFDSALVFFMVLETWIMSVVVLLSSSGGSSGMGNTSMLKLVRLVRLTRMARLARLLRAIPELTILIKGLFVAARSVFFTLFLLLIIIYLFAIVFRQLTDGTSIGEQYFHSVPSSMSTLLLDGVLPDQSLFVRNIASYHLGLGTMAMLFILLSCMTVMNMLVGVLCEVVNVVSSVEKEQMTVNFVKQKLFHLLGADADEAETKITKLEFDELLQNDKAARIIQDMGVDVMGLLDFAEMLFEDDQGISFADFIEVVLQLRGSNRCTVKDIVDLRKFVVGEMNVMEDKISSLITSLMQSVNTSAPTHSSQILRGHTSADQLSAHTPLVRATDARSRVLLK